MMLREILPENYLDVNFVKLVSPIYYLQLLLGSNCIVISDSHISNVTIYQKIYTVFWIIAVSGSFYYFQLSYYYAYYDADKTLFYTFSFGILVQYLSYLINIIYAKFVKGDQTVKVILMMQKVDSALRRNNLIARCVLNYLMTILWIGYIVVAFGSGFAVYVFYNLEKPLYAMPVGLAIVTVYLEMVFTSTCIYYLGVRLKFMNEVIRDNLDAKKQGHAINQNKTLIISVSKEKNAIDKISLKNFTCMLTSILKLFHDVSNLFSLQLFNVIVTVFIWTFLVIESTVVGLRSKLISILASAALTLWMVFYFIQLTFVAFTCDWFTKQVHETKSLLLLALSIYYEDGEVHVRKAVWEMLSLIEFEKPIFSVCGIFVLDKSLPLKLIGVITSNVLVLIQYTSNVLNTN